jgi:hypothetical protein
VALRTLTVALALAAPAAAGEPTYLVEWTSRSSSGFSRLTLFYDHTLVRKAVSEGREEIKKRRLSDEEYDYYVGYFGDPDLLRAAGPHPSGTAGDFLVVSEVTFCPPGGKSWSLSFDSFSGLGYETLRIKSALVNLADSFGKVLPSPADFAPEKIPLGTILRRRDGALFKVTGIDPYAKMVELRGELEPYSIFMKIDDLRFIFHAP